jgi:hypothetical protein
MDPLTTVLFFLGLVALVVFCFGLHDLQAMFERRDYNRHRED